MRQRWTASGPAAEPVAGSSFDTKRRAGTCASPNAAVDERRARDEPLAERARAFMSGARAASSSGSATSTNTCRGPFSYAAGAAAWPRRGRAPRAARAGVAGRDFRGHRLGHPARFAGDCRAHTGRRRARCARPPRRRREPRAATYPAPSTGWPANGSSPTGVKIRARARRLVELEEDASRRGSARRATRCICSVDSPAASVNTASGLPVSGPARRRRAAHTPRASGQ